MTPILLHSFISINPLHKLLLSRAIYSTTISTIKDELFDNTLILKQFSSISTNDMNTFYFTIAILLAVYRLSPSEDDIERMKLNQWELYAKTQKITKQILIFLFVILIKNLENAI